MNIHLNRYNRLINYYTSTMIEGHLEKHHIIPKCHGGSDDINNLVLLPVRAHFIAHELLHKAYPNDHKLAHAFAMMCVSSEKHNRKPSSRLYALAKIARSNALTGIPRPEWVKEKLRKPKSNVENYKQPKSATHAANISKALKGKKKSSEHIRKSVEAKKAGNEIKKQKSKEKKDQVNILFLESGLSKKHFADLHGLTYIYVKRCTTPDMHPL